MKTSAYIEYFMTASLLGICRILPEKWIYALFRGLGALTCLLLPKRRHLSLINTGIAFPEMSITDRKKLVLKHFQNLGTSMATNALIMSGRLSNEDILSMVETDDWALLEEACNKSEKGVLVFSAHLGNWELMPQYIALRQKRKLHVIARKSNNEWMEERIIKPLRERFGVTVFYKKNAMMKIIKAARRGEISGLLIDQKLNPPNGYPIEFFGKTSGTTTSPALFQLRFGLTLLPIFMVHAGPRKYRLIIRPPVQWKDTGKPMEEQVLELTRVHQKVIEETIREYPEQWFWVHNRWKLKKNER